MNAEQSPFDGTSAARLRRVVVRLARILNTSASAEGLTPTQASVLAIVGAQDLIPLAKLAELEGINPSMLSRIVTKLDGLGLIQRLQHPDDQRAGLVVATDRGRETSERVRASRTETVTELVRGLPAEDAAALLLALPALEAMAGIRATSSHDGSESGT